MTVPPPDEGWRLVSQPGFPAGLGPLWARRAEQGWDYGLVLTADHANATGAVHGGVLLALADHALSLAAWEATGRKRCLTIQLDMQFMRAAAPGEFLRARGRAGRLTRTIAFMGGELSTSRVVAEAHGIWRIGDGG